MDNIGNTQRYSEVDLFSTQGRIGRRQYFFYSIIVPFVFFWIFASIAGVLSRIGSDVNKLSFLLLGLAILSVIFMMIRLTIQRCHDFNASGWMAIFAIIPLANIVFAMIPGNNGLNSYGEAPEPASSFISSAIIVLIALLSVLVFFSFLYFLKIDIRSFI